MLFTLRKTALALALTAATLPAAAQVALNDGLDGNWYAAGAGGRGISVDVLPKADGSAQLYGVLFSYDASGAPLWLSFLADLSAGQNRIEAVPVYRFQGGAFDNALPAPSSNLIGNVTIDLASCSQISFDFTMASGSGLPDARLELNPAQANLGRSLNPLCNQPPTLSACPATTQAEGEDCLLPSRITQDLYLPAGRKYLVRGMVAVESGAALTIAPGVTVQGHSDNSSINFLAVKAGARLYAEGTPNQPIVFTGPQAEVGSWGGVVIAGHSICNDAAPGQPCKFEAVPEITYGGSDLNDSSGVLRYVRIQWAGFAVRQDEELNSLTLMGVGAGTVLDHVQVDGGKDDGFEFFGGNVNASHLVCSNMGDDCFDFDQGYAGQMQFLLAWQGENSDIGSDSNGIESDNDSSAMDKLPRTRPQIANISLIGSNDGKHGLRIRRGSGGNYANLVVSGFARKCLALDDAATFAIGGNATAQSEALSMTHSFVGQCAGGAFEDQSEDAYPVSAWFAAGAGNDTGDPMLQGYLPKPDSPLLHGGKTLEGDFFRKVNYRGAFAGQHDDWTRGWTVNLPAH